MTPPITERNPAIEADHPFASSRHFDALTDAVHALVRVQTLADLRAQRAHLDMMAVLQRLADLLDKAKEP